MTATVEDTALTRAFMGQAEVIGGRLVALYDAVLAGLMSVDEFIDAASLLIGGAQSAMYGLADSSLAAWLTTETGLAVPALGISPPETNLAGLREGLAALIAVVDPEDPALRIARMGRAETAGAFQDGYSEAMRERDEVGGYVRVLNAGACQLCHWLYRDGYVWPSGKSFHKHPGCGCHPGPVLRGV